MPVSTTRNRFRTEVSSLDCAQDRRLSGNYGSFADEIAKSRDVGCEVVGPNVGVRRLGGSNYLHFARQAGCLGDKVAKLPQCFQMTLDRPTDVELGFFQSSAG